MLELACEPVNLCPLAARKNDPNTFSTFSRISYARCVERRIEFPSGPGKQMAKQRSSIVSLVAPLPVPSDE